MSDRYSWATNPLKYQRAIGKLGSDASESELKEEYVRIGGMLPEDFIYGQAPSHVTVEIPESDVMPIVDEEPKKKRGRPSKKK